MKKTMLITGASSEIGGGNTKLFLQKGRNIMNRMIQFGMEKTKKVLNFTFKTYKLKL